MQTKYSIKQPDKKDENKVAMIVEKKNNSMTEEKMKNTITKKLK